MSTTNDPECPGSVKAMKFHTSTDSTFQTTSHMWKPVVLAHNPWEAGDREELGALSKVFCGHDAGRSRPLHVGSIKGNIGHTENVSGLASLV